jgi:hypothetical protein
VTFGVRGKTNATLFPVLICGGMLAKID